MSQLPQLSAEPLARRFTVSYQGTVKETVSHYNELLKAMENAPSEEKLAYATVAAGCLNLLSEIVSR